jgi:hypothetical protein
MIMKNMSETDRRFLHTSLILLSADCIFKYLHEDMELFHEVNFDLHL